MLMSYERKLVKNGGKKSFLKTEKNEVWSGRNFYEIYVLSRKFKYLMDFNFQTDDLKPIKENKIHYKMVGNTLKTLPLKLIKKKTFVRP